MTKSEVNIHKRLKELHLMVERASGDKPHSHKVNDIENLNTILSDFEKRISDLEKGVVVAKKP